TWELKSACNSEITPETCDPTCTVVTALMVPVASTTWKISPRSTGEVEYEALSPPLRAKRKRAAPIKSAAIIRRRGFVIFIRDVRQRDTTYRMGISGPQNRAVPERRRIM